LALVEITHIPVTNFHLEETY